jgi:hypothetical protein
LRLHITGTNGLGKFQQAVGKGTFTVVDVDETGVI